VAAVTQRWKPYPGSWNAEHGKRRKPDGLFWLMAGMVVLTTVLVLWGWARTESHREECAALGGEFINNYRAADLCIRDGLIVKTWQR
jgi:hypothetical protein